MIGLSIPRMLHLQLSMAKYVSINHINDIFLYPNMIFSYAST